VPEASADSLLARDNDPRRPLPTVTFADTYTLKVISEMQELSYHGNGDEPGAPTTSGGSNPLAVTRKIVELRTPGVSKPVI